MDSSILLKHSPCASSLFSGCNFSRCLPSSMETISPYQIVLHHSALRALVSKQHHWPASTSLTLISRRLQKHLKVSSQSSNDMNSVSLELDFVAPSSPSLDKLGLQVHESLDHELPFQVPIANFPSLAVSDQQRISARPPQERSELFTQSDVQEMFFLTDSNDMIESARRVYKNQQPSIVEFLKGKNIFITGATGFLAKVLVEKILRIQPAVGQLFLLIKAKDLESAKKRLNNEILETELFKLLQERLGNSYKGFMMSKVTPVVGDITLNNFGLSPDQFNSLSSKLDVVVNSAASTAFDERYDHAFNVNTKGPQRILEFCKGCPRLQLLLHVSTAYVNGHRKGVVGEEPFETEQSIARELYGQEVAPDLAVDTEMKLIQKKTNDVLSEHVGTVNGLKEQLLKQAMKELGLERAKLFGWQDTYVFTKAMGEMMIANMREHLPVVIVRPSIVESSINEPFPGWIEGCRMMDPIVLSYGKGQLKGFLYDPKGVLDVIPVDMVVNAMLATMPHHACKPQLKVYQVTSSTNNPLSLGDLTRMLYEHFIKHPYIDNVGHFTKPKRFECYQDMESFIQSISITQKQRTTSLAPNARSHGHQDLFVVKAKERATNLARLYKPYTFYEGRFDNSNTKQMYNELSCEDSDIFKFDVGDINWDNYIKDIHIPGLRKHVNKGRGSTMQ